MDETYKIEINGHKVEFQREIDCVSDYVSQMQKLRDEILVLKSDFSKNREKIKNCLYELGGWTCCIRFSLMKMLRKHPDDNEGYPRHDVFKGYESGLGMGSHGFNSMLYKDNFTEEIFNDFYIKWLNEISVFIDSNGTIYPRIISVVNAVGNTGMVHEAILLTKADLGYFPPMHYSPDSNDMFEKYNKCWEYANSNFPMYYIFSEKYADADSYRNLWQRVLKSSYSDEKFEHFLQSEYKVWNYISRNYEKLKTLPNVSVFELRK